MNLNPRHLAQPLDFPSLPVRNNVAQEGGLQFDPVKMIAQVMIELADELVTSGHEIFGSMAAWKARSGRRPG